MALPPVNVNPQSSSAASNYGAVRSGGDLFLGGNPNLALLGKADSAWPWLIGGGLVAAIVVVWLWKR
jgi:hypothetical protein